MDTLPFLCNSVYITDVLDLNYTKEVFNVNTDKIVAEKIASEYAPKNTSKIVALRKLDRLAKRNAEIFAYTFGIVSSLVMGTGMSFAMGVIGGNTFTSVLVGIIIGLVGIVGVSVNYPIYKKILSARRKKYAKDILTLSDNIMKGSAEAQKRIDAVKGDK